MVAYHTTDIVPSHNHTAIIMTIADLAHSDIADDTSCAGCINPLFSFHNTLIMHQAGKITAITETYQTAKPISRRRNISIRTGTSRHGTHGVTANRTHILLCFVGDHHRIHTHAVDGTVAVAEEAQIAAHGINPHILQEHMFAVAVEIAAEMVVKIAYRLPIGDVNKIEDCVCEFEIDFLATCRDLHQLVFHAQIGLVEGTVNSIIEHLAAIDVVAEVLQFGHIADDERILGRHQDKTHLLVRHAIDEVLQGGNTYHIFLDMNRVVIHHKSAACDQLPSHIAVGVGKEVRSHRQHILTLN